MSRVNPTSEPSESGSASERRRSQPRSAPLTRQRWRPRWEGDVAIVTVDGGHPVTEEDLLITERPVEGWSVAATEARLSP